MKIFDFSRKVILHPSRRMITLLLYGHEPSMSQKTNLKIRQTDYIPWKTSVAPTSVEGATLMTDPAVIYGLENLSDPDVRGGRHTVYIG